MTYLDVDFGEGRQGIATVGYKILDTDGSVVVPRTTSGVFEIGHGKYGANVDLGDLLSGTVYWDTEEDGPVNAMERVDLEQDAGASVVTTRLTAGGDPAEGVSVWVTNESGNVVAGTRLTDSDGEATFLLDDGTTYLYWARRDGLNPVLGESFVAGDDDPHEFVTTEAGGDGVTYSADSDVEAIYGSTNVDKWADLNNNEDAGEITARKLWAREQAYARVNARLLHGPYEIPFDSPAPTLVVRMEAALAGVYLYQSRGVTDFDADGRAVDQLAHERKQFDVDVRDILTRRLRLDVTENAVTHPQVVPDEPEAPAEVTG